MFQVPGEVTRTPNPKNHKTKNPPGVHYVATKDRPVRATFNGFKSFQRAAGPSVTFHKRSVRVEGWGLNRGTPTKGIFLLKGYMYISPILQIYILNDMILLAHVIGSFCGYI